MQLESDLSVTRLLILPLGNFESSHQFENEKVGLKFNIQKMKIMASSSITSWQIDGETMETVTDFNFLGSKITADGDCSHEIKRHLLLRRKAVTNLAAAAAAAKSLQSCPTLCNPRDGSPPGFPSLGFSRQEHWSGLPFPSPMHESEK